MNKRLYQRALVVSFLAFTAAIGIACGSDDEPSLSSTAAPPAIQTTAAPSTQAPTPAPAAAAPAPAVILTPDGARIYEDVKYLSTGPRSSGTQLEKNAAEWIADKLRGLGYEVSLQEFPVANTARESTVAVKQPSAKSVPSVPFQGTTAGKILAPIVAAGIGRPGDFSENAKGAIVLIERGDLQFVDKVANAQDAGAGGILIYNNESGNFQGTLSRESRVPAVAISQAEGRALLAALDKGRVEAEITVGNATNALSRNVIAKPPGRECETVTGGHYDSVPQAPGASDNATGTATVIEIAAIVANKDQMGGNCLVLFGAEELGLVGSRYFVQQLTTEQRRAIRGMVNLDMVGVGEDGWVLIGSSEMQQRASNVSSGLGIQAARGNTTPGQGSDHASFGNAGIPNLFLHRLTDRLLHTPQDVIDRVQPKYLEEAARITLGMLESLNAGG